MSGMNYSKRRKKIKTVRCVGGRGVRGGGGEGGEVEWLGLEKTKQKEQRQTRKVKREVGFNAQLGGRAQKNTRRGRKAQTEKGYSLAPVQGKLRLDQSQPEGSAAPALSFPSHPPQTRPTSAAFVPHADTYCHPGIRSRGQASVIVQQSVSLRRRIRLQVFTHNGTNGTPPSERGGSQK